MKTTENELAVIRQELNELRQALAGMRGNGNGASLLEANAATDRRGMLKKMAGLAVGVATVGLLRPNSSQAASRISGVRTGRMSKNGAPDSNGDPWLVGTDGNFATLFTGLFNETTDQIDTQLRV